MQDSTRDLPDEVIELIRAMTGAAHVEIIHVRNGEPAGNEPMGDSASCSDEDEHTESIRKKLIDADEKASRAETAARLDKALKGIRAAQAKCLRHYDLLKAMEKSMQTPLDERTAMTMLNEIRLFAELTGGK